MKTIPDCIPDVLNSVLDTARMVSDDKFIHRKVLTKVMQHIVDDADFDAGSAEMLFGCLQAAYKALGVKDPYENEKARRNKSMLGLEKGFRSFLGVAPDRFSSCINLVIAGTLSQDVLGRAEAEQEILQQMDAPIVRDDREDLFKAVSKADRVMYIIDSAGEIVLDKLLIEEIAGKCKVTAVVANNPMLDAATLADADAVGLGEVAEVIEPGAPMLGLMLERASSGFREAFNAADVVIVRGETGFETLSSCGRETYFMFMAECESVASRLDVPVGSGVVCKWSSKSLSGVYEAVGSRQQGKVK